MAPSITEQKATLRRRMRMVRDLIDDRVLRSIGLWSELAALPAYQAATTVMAFAGTAGEPDTDSLFARLAADGKALVLPRMDDEQIVPRSIGAGLVRGTHGILEPQGDEVSVDSLDLVVVPALAYTEDGRRLGRGGGHYDRFLARLPARCVTVGVCFGEQLVDELPREPHDVDVDVVLVAPLAE